MPSGWEWIVILIVALLLFGNRLPSVMRSMGRGISEFKKGMREDVDETAKLPGASDEESGKGESKKESPK
jgi:sec-independent protein translocase protein TatA